MKKDRIAFLLFMFIAGASVCLGDYYCYTDRKCIGGGIQEIPIGKPMEWLKFTGSKSGLLMYVERAVHDEEIASVPFSDYRGLNKEAHEIYLTRRGLKYDPERVTRKLHVLTGDGKDKYVIPIPDKHGGEYDLGLFPNEHFVQFMFLPRYTPMSTLRIVNLETSQVFTFIRTERFELGEPIYSPDEKHFSVEISDRATSVPLLFVDGTMMLPYHDAEPPVPFVSPEEYDKRVERFTKRSGDYRGFALEGRSWSADGRFLFFVQPKGYRDDPGKPAASEPSLLILDTEKAGPGKDYRDYCVRVPFQLSGDMQKKVDSFDRDSRRLVPTLLENENAVELAMPDNNDIKHRVPLPADWKTADTIRAALEKAKVSPPVP